MLGSVVHQSHHHMLSPGPDAAVGRITKTDVARTETMLLTIRESPRTPARVAMPMRSAPMQALIEHTYSRRVAEQNQAKHTSDAVCAMFRGFSGIIQADAHSVYDALFRGEAVEAGAAPPIEAGCWAHARRYFWEAAIGHHAAGKEGLLRINAIFEQDEKGTKLPPSKRTELRRRLVAPLVDSFFEWAASAARSHTDRGSVSAALGYANRQKLALRRFLDDGRIAMTNNASERALRPIAAGFLV